jgi:3-oxoacyl-[acyl-carrier-protein] synthase III
MGACIEAAATSTHRRLLFGRDAGHLADDAVELCLSRSHHDTEDLDLLINTGIYDHHDALATILDRTPAPLGHEGMFAFDINNGGAGFITAAQLATGFVANGTAHLAMITAADADPSPRTSRSFPFKAAGGAVVLAPGKLGFERFVVRTFPEHASLFESRLVHDGHHSLRGRDVLEVCEAPAFEDCCVHHAVGVARELLAEAGLAPTQVDLLLASQYPCGFALRVAHALGIPEDRLPYVRPALRGTHTAGPIGALEAALTTRRFAHARHTLFVTAGAGITIGIAWYRAWE